jgi:hypothetical protein
MILYLEIAHLFFLALLRSLCLVLAYFVCFFVQAQILVRWALQCNYVCVPRSGSATKVERQAIAENSFRGVHDFVLDRDEMMLLDTLDVNLPAGQLAVLDGYTAADILSRTWDPTTAIL